MSSILKALNKLEKKTTPPVDDTVAIENDIHDESLTSQIGEKLNTQLAIKVVLTFFFTIIIIWLGIHFNPESNHNSPTPLQDITQEKFPQKQKTETLASEYTPSEKSKVLATPEPKPQPKPEKLQATEHKSKKSIPSKIATLPLLSDLALTDKTPPSMNNPTPNILETKETSKMEEGVPELEDNYDKIKKITDTSWLKLQAISWTTDTSTRIAVINNQIVKEGHTLDRIRIVHIGQDFVIVRDGAKDLRLEFGIK